MKYYLAAPYVTKHFMVNYKQEIEDQVPGAEVVSRWITQSNVPEYTDKMLNDTPEQFQEWVVQDVLDVAACDTLISFTTMGGRGGRHVEYGIALCLRKRQVIIGAREHIFHCEKSVEAYLDWPTFLKHEVKWNTR